MTNIATITDCAEQRVQSTVRRRICTDDATVISAQPAVVKGVTDTSEASTPGLVNVGRWRNRGIHGYHHRS